MPLVRSVFIVDAIPLQHQRRLYLPIRSPWIWASEVCHGGLDAFFHWPLCGPHVKLTSTTCFPKTCCRRHHWGSVRFFVMNRKTSDMLRHQSAVGNQKRLICLQAQPGSFALHPFHPPHLHSCICCPPLSSVQCLWLSILLAWGFLRPFSSMFWKWNPGE